MRRFRRIVTWTLSTLFVLVAAVGLFFWFTPWLSALLIVHAFASNDRQAMIALERHVPEGIETTGDITYGDDPAQRMDIFRPGQTSPALPVVLWVHGGAWIGGSKDGVANYLKILAGSGYVTVGMDYFPPHRGHLPDADQASKPSPGLPGETRGRIRHRSDAHLSCRRFRRRADRWPDGESCHKPLICGQGRHRPDG